MSEQEIINGNKIIAEFMGYFKSAMEVAARLNPTGTVYDWKEDVAEIESLKYHSSWDWLMPVVQKVNEKWELAEIDDDNKYLPAEKAVGFIRLALHSVNIQKTWKHVIKFINWYTSQPQPNENGS